MSRVWAWVAAGLSAAVAIVMAVLSFSHFRGRQEAAEAAEENLEAEKEDAERENGEALSRARADLANRASEIESRAAYTAGVRDLGSTLRALQGRGTKPKS